MIKAVDQYTSVILGVQELNHHWSIALTALNTVPCVIIVMTLVFSAKLVSHE